MLVPEISRKQENTYAQTGAIEADTGRPHQLTEDEEVSEDDGLHVRPLYLDRHLLPRVAQHRLVHLPNPTAISCQKRVRLRSSLSDDASGAGETLPYAVDAF